MSGLSDARPSDEEIIRYEKEIKKEFGSAPLVSELLDFGAIEQEYATGLAVYQSKISHIKKTCLNMRTVKKDGNCFYRAFAFRFTELVRQHHGSQWYDIIVKRALTSKDLMTTMGYDMSILEDFWVPFEEAILKCDEDDSKLLERFQTEHISDTIVCYLRLVTAALLKRDRDIYEAFVLDAYPSLDLFIGSCVEPSNFRLHSGCGI